MAEHGIRRWRRFAKLAVAVYTLFLLTAQFEHHDLACHLKTPLHCTSCASSLLGADPHSLPITETCRLADAGASVTVQLLLEGVLLTTSTTGRSPPSLFV
jgi:hypothetical protein